ncbi:HAMP domain-containing protein [Mumia zhuanghuii]|nr:HAMP domain-containing protein [Mumia zhuanghuii]
MARVTVQGWFFVVLAIMVLLVAVGTVVGAQLLGRTASASDQLIDQIQPARSEAYRFQKALLDQETGARGYVLTADPEFSRPYTEGMETEQDAAAALRRLLPDDPTVTSDLDRIQDAAETWRRDYAEPMMATVGAGGAQAFDPAVSRQAKVAFDELRTMFDEQNANLLATRNTSKQNLDDARDLQTWVFVTLICAFFVAGALMTLLVRMLVTRPLAILQSSSRTIADGDFSHTISQNGPSDIRAVANDVELMRHRIVEALDASLAQERLLQAQSAELDAQAADLRRSNAELEQFAYVASHDLQEPLRKVASFCQLLEKRYADSLDERGKQYIDFAVDGAKRMQVLITDLLTFSRVGRLNDQTEQVALDSALDEAVANLATALEEAHARVERPAVLPTIDGDPTLLTMLWQNLLANAVKFRAPDRAPVITITCVPAPEHDDSGSLLVTVTDNGIGIPPEFAEKVFVIFQRLHSREAYAGTGIGLSLCKKIVDHHGGRIWVDTEHVDGARICFTLPRRASSARAHAEALASATASATPTALTGSEGSHP